MAPSPRFSDGAELLSSFTEQPLSGSIIEPENRCLECLFGSLFFLMMS